MSYYVYYAALASGVSLIATVVALQRLCSRYRPERHYMRGPGPKWRQKHSLEGATSSSMRCCGSGIPGPFER
jgi:hypothetical protein